MSYAPATLFATQSASLARGYRLGVVILVGLLVAAVIVRLSVALGINRSTACFWVATIALMGAIGGEALSSPWMFALVAALVVVIIWRLEGSDLLRIAMLVLTVVLLFEPPLQWTIGRLSRAAVHMTVADLAPAGPTVNDVGDVWIIVLDGYPSEWALQSQFGDTREQITSELSGRGFSVNPNALAPYSFTAASLPSVLSGQYVLPPGTRIDQALMAEIQRHIGGRAAGLRAFREHGYSITMIESGWHLSRCGPEIETCITSGWYDEAIATLWNQSVLPNITRLRPGSALTHGTLRTFAELRQLTGTLPDNGTRDLVFAHSLAPHPPLALDRSCSQRSPTEELGGGILGLAHFSERLMSKRREAFLEQLHCVDDLTMQVIDGIPPDDTVVLFGDHGTDGMGQNGLPPEAWSLDMVRERFLTLAAVRSPGCDLSPVNTVDLLPEILACIEGADHTDVEPAALIVPNVREENGRPMPIATSRQEFVVELMSLAKLE